MWEDKKIETDADYKHIGIDVGIGEAKTTRSYCYQYPRPSVTTDIVIIQDKGDQPAEVLLVKRKNEPFKDYWAIAGGFLDMGETLLDCARRELEEETGIRVPTLTHIGVYDSPERDPRGRVITHVYGYISHREINPKAGDDAKEARFIPIDKLPKLAFDHNKIIEDAIKIMVTR